MPTRAAMVVGIALALVGLANRPTLAAPTPPLVVVAGPGNAPATIRARRALTTAALRRGSAIIDLTSKPTPPSQARITLSRGIEAYVTLKYGQAIKHLDAAIAEAGITGARGLTSVGLSDLFIYRGLSYTQQGNASKAWQDFVRAATLAPTRTLDPVRFPPRAVESFARAIKGVVGKPPAILTINSRLGCTTWLDGRQVKARQPLQLVRGEHYLRVDCPGFDRFGTRQLIQHATYVLVPTLTRYVTPTVKQVTALANTRGASTVIFALVGVSAKTPATLQLRLVRVDSGAELERVFAPLVGSDVTSRVRGVVDRLIDRVLVPPTTTKPITIRVVKPTPWYKRSWVWGLAGAAITAAILTPLLQDDNKTQTTFDLNPGGSLPW